MTMDDTNDNTSAEWGYLLPNVPCGLPGGFTLVQFIQSVLSGISGLPGQMVRPKYQYNPPKQPDIGTNWMAFEISEDDVVGTSYVGIGKTVDGVPGPNIFIAQENMTVHCSFYGNHSLDFYQLLRDGFQISQNREALQSAGMDFVSCSKAVRAPDLINERWCDRWEVDIYLRREIKRTYPVLTFLSFVGELKILQSNGVKTIALNSD